MAIFVVNNNHPIASDGNAGTEASPLLTIGAAAKIAQPGDTVLIRAGLYRECVVPARGGKEGAPIVYRAADDERVYIRGSEVVGAEWVPTSYEGIYKTCLPMDKLNDYNPFKIERLDIFPAWHDQMGDAAHRHSVGQVYVDGARLSGLGSFESLISRPNAFYSDGEALYVHFHKGVKNPARHLVEATCRKAVFRPEQRGLGYITIEGLILEHAANQAISKFWLDDFAPQQGLISCRSGHHWRIINNVIRHASSIGLDIGSEGRTKALDGMETPAVVGYHEIRGNEITDNGQGGICGLRHYGTQIIGNLFERNGNLGSCAWEEAAIKTHFYVNGLISGNTFRDNYCYGIWLDNVYQDVRVTKNIIIGSRASGIFCEMGGGPCLIDHNIIAHTLPGPSFNGGNGIIVHDAGGVTITHNLIMENARYGVQIMLATNRKYSVLYGGDDLSKPPVASKPCDCENIDIYYNRFVENTLGAIYAPMPGEHSRNVRSDCNDFNAGIGESFGINHTADYIKNESSDSIIISTPPIHGLTLTKWREITGNDTHSELIVMKNMGWVMLHAQLEPFLVFSIDKVTVYDRQLPIGGLDTDLEGVVLGEHAVAGPYSRVNKPGDYRFELPLFR